MGTKKSELALPSVRRSRSLEQLGGVDPQYDCELVDDIDRRGVDAALQRADIGAIYVRAMRELLLRQTGSLPASPQVARENLSNLH